MVRAGSWTSDRVIKGRRATSYAETNVQVQNAPAGRGARALWCGEVVMYCMLLEILMTLMTLTTSTRIVAVAEHHQERPGVRGVHLDSLVLVRRCALGGRHTLQLHGLLYMSTDPWHADNDSWTPGVGMWNHI